MAIEDTILIKIGVSYKEGMTPEELYHATSVSWVISEKRLRSGELKYYCAIYNNEIKEVYKLLDYEKDTHPDNIGRFILHGTIAEDPLRSNLLKINVRDIHKGSGNPIKYIKMAELLAGANETFKAEKIFERFILNKKLIKLLFKGLAENKKEIRTLSTNKPNWITEVDDVGINVETETSREKYSRGEKNKPYAYITYDYILAAFEEFLNARTASANNFVDTRGRSRFVMAFFNELPFVEKVVINNTPNIKIIEFTTDQLPESNLEQTLELLDEIIDHDFDPKTISQKYREDSIKRLKLRARQGLKLLGFLNEEYKIQPGVLEGYINSLNRVEFLTERILKHSYSLVIYKLLTLLKGIAKSEKFTLLTEIGMGIVRNSAGSNLMVQSVSQQRTRNILNWFMETGLVDEEWNVLENNKFNNEYSLTSSASLIRESPLNISLGDLVAHINKYIAGKGFYYEKEEIINLFLSLKTKPFIILSGISGTGKTKMVQWFAESVGATEENGQFALIPVRPDWNDGSDLLGYRDIRGEFLKGPLTKIIERAIENHELPYFVLLDEMNLARVEYYFSDILSVMESRKWEEGQIVSSNLLSKANADVDLKLPNNVYIIGTVNMDETTHPFSKKVLDRANTIEFNRVELDYLEFLKDLVEVDPIVVGHESFASNYLHLKDVYSRHPRLVEQVTSELVNINKALQLINAHVGYRVRDEICFYLAYNEEGNFMSFEEAMDHCIIQKILPRIAGSDSRVEELLRRLYLLFTNKAYDEELDRLELDLATAKYPHSAAKVAEMLRGLKDGFTSFWIS